MDNRQAATALPPKPRRPLNSFNLYYRYKRQHVIRLVSSCGGKASKDDVAKLIETAPGLEGISTEALVQGMSPVELNNLRRDNVRREMANNLSPRETGRRVHRTDQMGGTMSFVELGKLMNSGWKACDEFTKKVFIELVEEGREIYRRKVDEYNDMVERGYDGKMHEGETPRDGAPKSKGPAKKRSFSPQDYNGRYSDRSQVELAEPSGIVAAAYDQLSSSVSKECSSNSAFARIVSREYTSPYPPPPVGTSPTMQPDAFQRRNSASRLAMQPRLMEPYRYQRQYQDQNQHHQLNIQGQGQSHTEGSSSALLRLRVGHLEDALTAARLRARAFELEGQLSRYAALRSQLGYHQPSSVQPRGYLDAGEGHKSGGDGTSVSVSKRQRLS